MSWDELVSMDLVDPIKVFVKNEPHPSEKIRQGRFRLIMAVSIVDQVVSRLLHGDINKAEIRAWTHVPCCPGIGFNTTEFGDNKVDQFLSKREVLLRSGPIVSTDMSGFDWTCQAVDHFMVCALRADVYNLSTTWTEMASKQEYLLMRTPLVLSDGTFVMRNQSCMGIQLSGKYMTSAGNSAIRIALALGDCIAMGDDGLESEIPGLKEYYLSQGMRVKTITTKSGGEFEFCSHIYNVEDRTCYLSKHGKTLFTHFNGKRTDVESGQLWLELGHNPLWPSITSAMLIVDAFERGHVSPALLAHTWKDEQLTAAQLAELIERPEEQSL